MSVVMKEGRAENTVPRQAAVFSHIDQEGDSAVGKWGNYEALLKTQQGGDGVRPRGKVMPNAVEVDEVRLGKRLQLVGGGQQIQPPPEQGVDIGPRLLAEANTLDGEQVALRGARCRPGEASRPLGPWPGQASHPPG
jgi:hypothetical protein